MWILIIGLLVLAIVAMTAGYIRNRNIQKKIEKGELNDFPDIVEADAECCGQHEICEKDSLLAAVSTEIEYYDDPSIKCKVVGDRKVEYQGKEMSLTAAAKLISGKKYSIAGPRFFKYKGEWLNDIRARIGF